MRKNKMPGVKKEPSEPFGLVLAAVAAVPDDRMPGRGKVNPDLVSPSRNRPNLEKRKFFQDFFHRIIGQGLPGLFCPDRDALPVSGMPADGPVYFSRHGLKLPPNQPEIDLFDFACLELALELGVGREASGHNHNAGCFLVEPVNNPRPFPVANFFDSGKMVEKGVDQSPIRHSRAGMDDEAGWLVDDDDVFIAIENIQSYLFRVKGGRRFFRDLDLDDVPRPKLEAGL